MSARAVVTGASALVLGPGDATTVDPRAFLASAKSRKYMGVQDDLAVVAAGEALARAGLRRGPLGERAGLYMAVGYIPFDASDIAPVLEASLDAERFSMARFARGGFQKAHPLLTFRCLPNMPAYHVSVNFGVRGPYFVTYPGAGQLYLALEEACVALTSGVVDVALLMGVAHQRNFLVEHHFRRIAPPVARERLRDTGACLVLETEAHARDRGATVFAALDSLAVDYTPFDPLGEGAGEHESLTGAELTDGALGPASLLCALASATSNVRHRITTRDGITASSVWTSSPSGPK